MDFSLAEEQKELCELARKILEDRAGHDRIKAIEASAQGIDRDLWAELAKAHLLGLGLPEAHGGAGFGFFELCLFAEEIGRAVAPVPFWPTLALGALPIAGLASDAQKRRFLPRVTAGELILSGALAEESSRDLGCPATTAARDGAAWRLSGTKICVPAAHVAERVLVPARDGRGAGLFLLDPAGAGVSLEPVATTHGERQFRMVLDGARVAAADVLRAPGEAQDAIGWIAARATTLLCAMQLGVADRALRMTAEYTSGRMQFDRPIGSFQAVHQRAGDAYVDLEAMRLTCWQAALRLAEGRDADAEVAVAKYWAAEGGHRVAYAAQHLHGGIGMDLDYPLHRYYLWTRHLELTLGTAPEQLVKIGDWLATGGGS
jgi:alkylation response protein AidB-like acyl-CoA dehydrogenase